MSAWACSAARSQREDTLLSHSLTSGQAVAKPGVAVFHRPVTPVPLSTGSRLSTPASLPLRPIVRGMRSFIITVLTSLVAFFATPPAFAYVDPSTGASTASGVIRAFDKPAQNWLPGHRGVDLRLAVGADVLASGSGVVAFAGMVVGTPTISIDHADGVRTTYQPVHPLVATGDLVEEGSVIGRLAHPTTQWPGLQWGAKRGEDYLNPLSLLSAPTIRLKPSPAGGGP